MDVVGIIVFVVFIALQLLGRMARKTAARAPDDRPAPPARPPRQRARSVEAPDRLPWELREGELGEDAPAAPTRTVPPPRPAAPQPRESRSRPQPAPRPSRAKRERAQTIRHRLAHRRSLREALVLREILGPPLALRGSRTRRI
jgi:hypothetical protein